MSYVVYAHIDPRTELPYYIGKGTVERANDFYRGRNTFHKRLTAKITPTVTILHTTEDEQEAFELEIKEIEFYGRRDSGSGPLVNLTDGGEGASGCGHSQVTKDKIGSFHKGKYVSEETKVKMRASRASFVRREHKRILQ